MPQATRSYGYDTVNRLTAASDSSGWNRQFGYDAWGNMWVTANSGVNLAGNTPTANVYNSNNQTGGTSYDAAGNALSVNGFTLGYDAENRQVSATEQPSLGGGQELYLYDGNGQRVEKVSVGGNTIYVYDAFGQLAAEYNTFASSFACTTCYDTADQLGSVRMVTDQSGNAVTRHDCLPFGEEIAGSSPSMDVEQRFTGQIRDTETGMDFFNARYYTAPLGRFNSVDPENAGADLGGPQTWNGYAYVIGNPLALTDPSGLDPDGGGGGPVPVSCPDCSVTVNGGSPDPVVTGDPGAAGIVGASGKTAMYSMKNEMISRPVSPAPDPAQVAFGETGGIYPQQKRQIHDKVSIYDRRGWDPQSLIQLQLARRRGESNCYLWAIQKWGRRGCS